MAFCFRRCQLGFFRLELRGMRFFAAMRQRLRSGIIRVSVLDHFFVLYKRITGKLFDLRRGERLLVLQRLGFNQLSISDDRLGSGFKLFGGEFPFPHHLRSSFMLGNRSVSERAFQFRKLRHSWFRVSRAVAMARERFARQQTAAVPGQWRFHQRCRLEGACRAGRRWSLRRFRRFVFSGATILAQRFAGQYERSGRLAGTRSKSRRRPARRSGSLFDRFRPESPSLLAPPELFQKSPRRLPALRSNLPAHCRQGRDRRGDDGVHASAWRRDRTNLPGRIQPVRKELRIAARE